MAIYHCTIKNISRSKGQSAVASAAYRSGEKLYDEKTEMTFDYTSKGNIAYTEIVLCENAPSEYQDRQTLWNEVQKAEKAKDARLAREWEVAIPNELSLEQAKELTRGYAKSLAGEGMCVDFAIHWKEGNHHAHIMGTTRPIKENGEWGQKEKKVYKLDENGQKIPQIDPKTGEQKIGAKGRKMWERETVQANDWNKQEKVEEWRGRWAEHCNRYLEKDKQIDHRSYKRQGKGQLPTIREGYRDWKMERNGQISEVCQHNRDVKEINRLAAETNENKAFIETLKENDSRLQDLDSLRTCGGAEEERRYNFAYETVVEVIEQHKQVPVLVKDGSNGIAVAAESEPSKALERLKDTKDEWKEFIQKSRERLSEAFKATKEEKANKYTLEQEKPFKTIVERFKGYFDNIAEARARRLAEKEQERARRTEELAKMKQERANADEFLKKEVYRNDDVACIEQIKQVAEMYHKTDDTYIKDACIKKLGEITGLKTKEYDPRVDMYNNLTSRDISPAEVDKAVNASIERRLEQIERNKVYKEIQAEWQKAIEKNREKVAEMQRERQARNLERGGRER